MTILGIDHGYGMIKTANTKMLAGVKCYDNTSASTYRTLQWNGKNYVCGSTRQPLEQNKTINENYFVLTLAAICKELQFRNIPGIRQEIKLAVGLPLTRISYERQRFIEYLKSFGDDFDVRYEGKRHLFTIKDVVVYPQGYSTYATHTNPYKDQPSIIFADCGSWTIDIMQVDNGIPKANSFVSLNYGTIRLMNLISEQVRRSMNGAEVSESQIDKVLNLEISMLDDSIQSIIMECAEQYAHDTIATMTENGLDITNMPVVFMGGGAAIMKNFAKTHEYVAYIDNIHANARAFEQIAKQAEAQNAQAAI